MDSYPSSPGRNSSFRSLNFTLNRSELSAYSSVYSSKSKVSTYATLREKALVRRVLFEDPVFPANDDSLRIKFKSFSDDIEWKRPHEISRRPTFISNHPDVCDVTSGSYGDSWLLPAFSCLSLAPYLIQKCIPEGQAFDDQYGGIFRFRFWRYGEWIEIVIDDRLPTHKGQILFTRNKDINEFWIALFEKAYAKLYGSYASIQGSTVSWALQDITGGITDTFIFKQNTYLMQKIIDISMARSSLLSATVLVSGAPYKQLPNGIITGRAYTITGYAEIPMPDGNSAIITRLRNPWGQIDWNGPWSNRSTLWHSVSNDIKYKLGYGDMKNNEFWMPFAEFSKLFTNLELCHLTPEAWKCEPKLKHRLPWKSVEAHRQWRRGFNAGGGMDSPALSCNSQFYIELHQQSYVVLSLMQKYRLMGVVSDLMACGCHIFKILDDFVSRIPYDLKVLKAPQGRITRLQSNSFVHSSHIASTGMRTERDIVRFFTLPAGSYVILPVTVQAGIEGKFYLRIFTDNMKAVVRELDDPNTAAFTQIDRQLDPDIILNLRKRFMMFSNRYEELDGYGLRNILSFKQKELTSNMLCCQVENQEVHIRRLFLSPETCKAAITIFDSDMNGRLCYDEYLQLVQKLSFWQNIFNQFAVENGSVIDSYSLRHAFRMAGFSLSNKVLEALVLRFAAKDFMNLEGFINSVVKLHVAHQSNQKSKEANSIPTNEVEQRKFLQELLRTAIYS